MTPRPARVDVSTRADPLGLVMGHGRFIEDLRIPGVLTCHFVRSSLAHGRIVGVDVSEAAVAPGVISVLVGSDLGLRPIPGNLRHGPEARHMTRPPLAEDKVRYVGEPIAVVIADTPTRAADAADLIFPDLEHLPVVTDARAAARDEVLLFTEAGSNVVDRSKTGRGPDRTFPVRSTIEVINNRVSPLALEPLGIIAEPADGGLRIFCGHQAPHRLRSQLADLLDIELDRIRVTVPNVGGGFGAKAMLYPEYLVVAAAALRLGRPVRWVAKRREELTGGIHGRSQLHRIHLEGETDGTIKSAHIEIVADVGAYPHNGSLVAGFTRFMAGGPYLIENVATDTTIVVTNTAPIGTYRGAGRPEAAYAIERAIERFARQAGIDPIEVRRRNLIREEDLPFTTTSGAIYDSGNYRLALETALKMIDMTTVRAEQARRLETIGPLLGIGVAVYVERAGGPLVEGEYASVGIVASGRLEVRVGAVDTGQGHETLWRLIARTRFDLASEQIDVFSADTDLVPSGVGTFASRSTQICGSVVHRCSEVVFEKARRVAGDLLDVSPTDLIARDGRFEVVDRSGVSVALVDVARAATNQGVELRHEETWVPGAHTFPYGAHVAVVEIDQETGDVALVRALAVDDCGNVIDTAGTLGQIHGSLAQGIGQARFEDFRYDEMGQPMTATLVDYMGPRASDLPSFEVSHLVSPAPSNPLGAKGVGESGCIGFPPALVNAVLDALAPLGVDHIDMPMTSGRVWAAIQAGAEKETPERMRT